MIVYGGVGSIQVGPDRFMATDEAARRGVKAWKPGMPAPAIPPKGKAASGQARTPAKAAFDATFNAVFDAELARLKAMRSAQSVEEVAKRFGCTVAEVRAIQAKRRA